MKIPGILYLENSEYAKRSKYVAWQAAVGTSTSSEQLAFQVLLPTILVSFIFYCLGV